MEFLKELKIMLPSEEEISEVNKLQEIDSEFISDRELWILENFSEAGGWE
ncbi:MAG TPA: hypothetical protein VJG83_00085 [archaeon]|nr:hypothetical protein [archaeon]